MKFNSLVPELDVWDFARSLRFYVDVLGFEILHQRSAPDFALLAYGDAQLMIEQAREDGRYPVEKLTPLGRGVNFQIRTTEVAGIAERLLGNGFSLQRDLYTREHIEGSERICEAEIRALDPDGYVLRFSQIIGREAVEGSAQRLD